MEDCQLASPVGNWDQSNPNSLSPITSSQPTSENENHTYSTCLKNKIKPKKNNDIILSKIHHIHSTCLQARPSKQPMTPPKCAYDVTPYKNPTNTSSKSSPNQNHSKYKTFGDHLSEKDPDDIRIVSQNINCLGISTINNPKQERAINWLIRHEVDIIGWQEIGIAFHMLPHSKRLAERLKDPRWTKQRISSTHNKHEKVDSFQYGGTAMATFDEPAHRVHSTGGDTTGLGRWSWITFNGKNNVTTRIISAYVPCKSSNDKYKTVYNQHRRYFLRQGNTECPRKLFQLHLVQSIKKWQQQGEQIVLLIDMNENLSRMGPIQSALCYECQLIDPIREIHHKSKSKLPPTSLTGSVPIDGIFVSPQLRNISKGGWISISESIGDHRALFIDVPSKILLGENSFTIHRHTARRLTCDRPNVVGKFNDLLQKQLQNQHTFSSFDKFMHAYQNNAYETSHQIIADLNKIDRSITNAVRYAEKKCRKINAGNVPYTPELSNAGQLINLWNNIIRKKKGCNISSKYLQRIAKKLGVSQPMKLSLHDCELERKSASRNYRKLKKNAQQSRTLFMHDLAAQHAARGNESISNVILRMTRNEELRSSYRRIKNVTKPFLGATEKVLTSINNSLNEETTTTDKETIEKALSEENIKKFTTAYSSPFLQKPLSPLLGQTATSSTAQKILNGTFSDQIKLSKSTKLFIQHLKMPTSILNNPPNDSQCSLSTAKAYWRKKREKTNSSMSQRHIGTYKAMTYDLPLLRLVNSVSNIAFNIGHPLERWTFDLDVSLLKKPNKIRPSELRTIGTLEADFNQNASLHFSRRMMGLGIRRNIIPSSQYAKKGNRAIEAAIVKILIFDYLRFNRKSGAFIAMDLMNCFDRMAHPVSSLCTQRLGIHPQIANCMIRTLCQMKHFIRTAYGDSQWSYIGTTNRPLQGAVQGNGAASPIFVAISCVILSFLQSQVVGVYITSAITLTVFSLIAIMYVDDSDIILTAIDPNESPLDLQRRAQRAATTYQSAVAQTGGAVRPEKCRWYSICFKVVNGKYTYIKNPKVPDIQICNSNNTLQHILRLAPSQGWKGLGVITAPDGNWNDHVKYIIEEKIQPWNKSILSSYLQKHDIYRSATTAIFKTIDYSLPATFLSSKQCSKINAQLHKVLLPKIGIDAHLPLVYRYAPSRYQGLNSLNVETKQFIEKLKIFLFHMSTKSQLSQSLQMNLESLQLLIGTNFHIFHLPYEKYGIFAPSSWITHLWEMSCLYGVNIDGHYEKTNPTRCHDFALMDKIIQTDEFTTQELLQINRCRVYLQVQNLSDISTGDGKHINYCAIHHIKNPDYVSTYKWPNQVKPPKKDWEMWNQALVQVWSKNEQHELDQPLGEYFLLPKHTLPWQYHPPSDTLYYKISTLSYNMYKKSTSRRRNNTGHLYTLHSSTFILPPKTSPALVNRLQPKIVLLEHIITTVNDYQQIEEVDKHIKLFFDQVSFPNDPSNLIQHIELGTAIAVTDASVSPDTGIGASSFIITTPDLQCACTGSHGVPKGSQIMDSYRAELYGIFSTLLALSRFIKIHNIHSGSITIACDNKASLEHAFSYEERAAITQSSHDILWAIHDIRIDIPIQFIAQHVKGHQDRTNKPLTLLEKLNCYVDIKAGEYRECIEGSTTYEYSDIHWFSNWHCSIDGQKITSSLESTIKTKMHTTQIQQYLIHNKGYSPKAFTMIDWSSIEKAATTLTIHRQIWLTKFVSGFCATAAKMHERKQWESPLCPLCSKCNENTKHVITCKDDRAQKKYALLLRSFIQFLHKINTHPFIIHTFENSLQHQQPTSFVRHSTSFHTEPLLLHAASQQDVIGWHNFFKGHLSIQWKELQLQYFKQMYTQPPSADLWMKQVILQVYEFSHGMWIHRNNIVHEQVEERLTYKQSKQLEERLIRTYIEGNEQVLRQHQHLFNERLSDLQNKTVSEKRYWILTVESSRACYLEQGNNSEKRIHEDTCVIDKKFATVPD